LLIFQALLLNLLNFLHIQGILNVVFSKKSFLLNFIKSGIIIQIFYRRLGERMEKIVLILGTILTSIGMYKIDKFLIPTLDYFGKYAFFIIFNIFIFWSLWISYKLSSKLKMVMPIFIGAVILIAGISI